MARIRISRPAQGPADLLSSAITGWLQHLEVEKLFVTCLTCQHLSELGTSCNLVPGDRPIPAHIVIKGCEAYSDTHPDASYSTGAPTRNNAITDDDIPF